MDMHQYWDFLPGLFGPPLSPGTPAPGFQLPDEQGNTVRLSDLRGSHVVLIFYPRDETPVCRRQLCEFRDQAELLLVRNALVFGVNPQGAGSHRKFRERHGLPFPLLVDRDGATAAAYRAGWRMFVRRTVYLIGPDGRILYSRRGTPPPEEVLSAAVS